MKSDYDRRRARGVCNRCANPADHGVFCEPCSVLQAAAGRRRYYGRRRRGVCVDCEQPAETGGPRCALCRLDVNARARACRRRKRMERMEQRAAEGTW